MSTSINKSALKLQDALNRRIFLKRATAGAGIAALSSMMGRIALGDDKSDASLVGGLKGLPHFAPKAKRIIYLHQSGAPSQFELFDYKPKLDELRGQDLPESIRNGQRITTMTSGAEKISGREFDFQIQAAWKIRRVAERVVAAHSGDC